MTKEEKKWFNLGRRVKWAEEAGNDDEVNRLVDQVDGMVEKLKGSPTRRAHLSDVYVKGRYS